MFSGLIEKAVTSKISDETIDAGLTFSEMLAPVITLLGIRIVLAILGFIIGLIVFHLLRNAADSLNEHKWFKTIDRLFGVIVRLGIVFAAVYAIFYLSDSVAFFKSMAEESMILQLFAK